MGTGPDAAWDVQMRMASVTGAAFAVMTAAALAITAMVIMAVRGILPWAAAAVLSVLAAAGAVWAIHRTISKAQGELSSSRDGDDGERRRLRVSYTGFNTDLPKRV